MSASEWREAAKVYANKFPDVSKQIERNIKAEAELMEFLMSDDWKAGQVLLAAGNRSINLGSTDLSSLVGDGCKIEMAYILDAYGLRWHSKGEQVFFEAATLDTVHAFYRFDRHRGDDIVEYIKHQLDVIAIQMLREASK